MADGMDKGLMALMGIEDDTIILNASEYSSGSLMSDMDEDSPTLEQSSYCASPNDLVSTNSGRPQRNQSNVLGSLTSRATSHSNPFRASSSSLFIRTPSPVDDPPEWHSNSGMLQKTKPSRRSKDKAVESGGFMFSPALKPKKNTSKPRMLRPLEKTHQAMAPIPPNAIHLSNSPNFFPGILSADRHRSPLLSFDMKSCPKSFSDDHSDSEISSLDEGISHPSVLDHQNVLLNSSFSSGGVPNADAISEFGSGSISKTLVESVASASSVDSHEWDRDSVQDIDELSMTPKPIRLSKKQDLQETKERERLLRIGGTNLKSAVNKKLTLQSLMKETLAKQQYKERKAEFKLDSVSLSSSEDEVEMEARQEKERGRLETSRAFLVARDQVLGVKEQINVIASPFSEHVQNLSLVGSSSQGLKDSVSTAKPVATYSLKKSAPSGFINFNSQMKREVSKRILQHRKILNDDAENSGNRRSFNDYAKDHLSNEGRKVLEPADEAEVGEGRMGTSSVAEDDEDLDLRREFDEEDDADTESEIEGLSTESEVYNMQTESEASGSETCDSEQDSGGTQPVKIKRAAGRKSNVIGDDDSDLKVVLIDHSQARCFSKSKNLATDNSGNRVHDTTDIHGRSSNDEDVSDLDEPAEQTKRPGSVIKSKCTHKSRVRPIENRGSNLESSTISSSLTNTAAVGLSQASEKETTEVLSGALDFLSGRFPLARSSSNEVIPVRQETVDKSSPIAPHLAFLYDSRNAPNADRSGGIEDKIIPRSALNTSNQGHTRGRRLIKQAPKRVISRSDKSAFIEYEAEEEEDEFMGMGGVDYESDNPENDDYDVADDMIDSSTKLGSRDAENVRKLHMQHEQDRHNKDISDLVHGIAAGSLWKRRNGQVDDLDLFDEEDMDGRFRRKKKLKISEKLEELADNPTTLAFSRAFTKNVDDDRLVFLSDVDETDSERESPQKINTRRMILSDRDDIAMMLEDEDVEETLDTNRRKERLREARLLAGESIDRSKPSDLPSGMLTSVTRAQVLPFGTPDINSGTELTPGAADKLADPLDGLKQVLRRNRVIRSIIDDTDELSDARSPPFRSQGSSFNPNSHLPVKDASFLDEKTVTLLESISIASHTQGAASEASASLTVIAKPEKLVRQSSNFLPKDRKSHFLRTVGDESRQSTRVVKDVNRRRMAFAHTASSESAETEPGSK